MLLKKDIKNVKNWEYQAVDDYFICPNKGKVPFKKYVNKRNHSGYVQSYKVYECEDCSGCPLKSLCTKSKGNRKVYWNPVYEEMKAKVRQALECDENAQIYAQRKIEVENVFDHIKGNRRFRRFSPRGLIKVHIEFGIVAIAHNIVKVFLQQGLSSDENNKRKWDQEKNLQPLAFIFRLFGQPLFTF